MVLSADDRTNCKISDLFFAGRGKYRICSVSSFFLAIEDGVCCSLLLYLLFIIITFKKKITTFFLFTTNSSTSSSITTFFLFKSSPPWCSTIDYNYRMHGGGSPALDRIHLDIKAICTWHMYDEHIPVLLSNEVRRETYIFLPS